MIACVAVRQKSVDNGHISSCHPAMNSLELERSLAPEWRPQQFAVSPACWQLPSETAHWTLTSNIQPFAVVSHRLSTTVSS